MSHLFCDTNLQNSIFSPSSNSDQTILFIQGAPEEVIQKIEHIIITQQNLDHFTSLRVRVKGSVVKERRYCCIGWTILVTSILVLPLPLLCTDCFRQKTQKIQDVKEEVYRRVSRLLTMGSFNEFYISVEDNLLNRDKVEHLREGVRGRVKNLFFWNKVRSFNVLGNNYGSASQYFQRLLNEVEYAECRWDKEVWSNIRFDR